MAGEMLGPMLVSLHNIRHFQRFMLDIRRAIAHNDWSLATVGTASSNPRGESSDL